MWLPGLLAFVTAVMPVQTVQPRSYAVTAPAPQPLPLVVLAPTAPSTGTLALLLTGDGGWSKVDRTIADRLIADGDAVVGLNSLHYFAQQRTSTGMAADLSEVARAYCQHWNCQRIVLVGYSMGADALPFVVNQLAPDVRAKLTHLDLISLGHEAVFRFSPMQWVGVMVGRKFATLPQLALVKGIDILCIYGENDRDPACKDVPSDEAKVVSLPSGHVMSKVAVDLAAIIAQTMK